MVEQNGTAPISESQAEKAKTTALYFPGLGYLCEETGLYYLEKDKLTARQITVLTGIEPANVIITTPATRGSFSLEQAAEILQDPKAAAVRRAERQMSQICNEPVWCWTRATFSVGSNSKVLKEIAESLNVEITAISGPDENRDLRKRKFYIASQISNLTSKISINDKEAAARIIELPGEPVTISVAELNKLRQPTTDIFYV